MIEGKSPEELADSVLAGDVAVATEIEDVEAVAHLLSVKLFADAEAWRSHMNPMLGFQQPGEPIWIKGQEAIALVGRRLTEGVWPEQAYTLAVALIAATSWGQPQSPPHPTVRADILDLIERVAPYELLATFHYRHWVGGMRPPPNTSIRRQLWERDGASGKNWFRFFYLQRDGVRSTIDTIAYRPDEGYNWSETNWLDALDVMAKVRLEPMPEMMEHPYSLIHGAPDRGLPLVMQAFLLYERDSQSMAVFASAMQKRLSGTASDAELFFWPTDSHAAEKAAWLIQATVGDARYPEVLAAAQATGRLEVHAAVLYEPIQDSPGDKAAADWAFKELVSIGAVDAKSGALIACDTSVWFEDETPAWRVETVPDEVEVLAVMAAQPVQGEFPAGWLLRLGAGEVDRWERLLSEADTDEDQGFVPGAYYPDNSMFGIVDPVVYGDYAENGEQIIQDGIEAADESPTSSIVVDIGGSRSVMGFCGQDVPIRSWVGLNSDGHIIAMYCDFNVLDIDPVRDEMLPWN